MKQLLIFAIVLASHFSISQESNTFFITKKTDRSKVRLVLSEGNKLKVQYTSERQEHVVKGRVDSILVTSIVVNGQNIALNEIDVVTKHRYQLKVAGGLFFAGGAAMIAKGLERKENPVVFEKKDLVNVVSVTTHTVVRDGDGLIVIGGIICTFSSVAMILPNKCSKNKFQFNTHVH